MSESTRVRGECQSRFEPVREVFSNAFVSGAELGAAVCVTYQGETVVDLWGGFQDAESEVAWQRDTLVNVFSTSKGIIALALHRLIDAGQLELDAPVARYWPEFAQAGKGDLPVRYLLSHRAGLPAVAKPLAPGALYDWETMTGALAEQEPWWTPGEKQGYHALTFGWLVGELVRRLSGKGVGRYVREEIAEPLGVEFHIGCPERLDPRIADLVPGPVTVAEDGPAFDMVSEILNNPEGLFARAFANPPPTGLMHEFANSRAWREAEIPAANGHTNAHSLARIYAALANGGEVDGVRIFSEAGIARARTEQGYGEDVVLPMRSTRYGLGFMLPTDDEPVGPNPQVFGHAGAGGSYGVADPENRISLGYTPNKMHEGVWLVDPRGRRLLRAVYASLADVGGQGAS